MSSVPTTFEGPVCNLNAKVNVQQPAIQSMPQIPVANDLPSALQAIQSLSQIMQILINQLPGQNNTQQNSTTQSPRFSARAMANEYCRIYHRLIGLQVHLPRQAHTVRFRVRHDQ